MNIDVVKIDNPKNLNLIFGQSHFIKTVEDLHETLVNAVPGIKFGLAFCESSGPRLIRTSGTAQALTKLAAENARKIGCGHTFIIFLENAFPINVLKAVQNVVEVVGIFCATANEAEVIVATTEHGRAVLGIVDGGSPLGIEQAEDQKERKSLLRKFGYKQ